MLYLYIFIWIEIQISSIKSLSRLFPPKPFFSVYISSIHSVKCEIHSGGHFIPSLKFLMF